jgi:hypothetical protein
MEPREALMPRTLGVVRAVLPALLLVAAVGSAVRTQGAGPVPEAPPEAVAQGFDSPALLADVSPQVEEIRGLRFKRPVSATVIGAVEARAYASKRLRLLASDDDLKAEQDLYEILGLIPKGEDILKEYLDVFDEQAGGFYDPGSKTFSLLGHMPRGIGPFLTSHELTHALEDQYFDLDGRLAAARGNDDAIFALSAVHEGSATLVMAFFGARAAAAGKLKAEDLEELAESGAGKGEKLQAMPPVLRRQLLGAYFLGARFLLRGRGGYIGTGSYPVADAERCYRDGPESSEQILHPEKYWDETKRDRPRRVVLADAGRPLGEGWRREGSGILGELTLGVLVGAPTPSAAEAGMFPGGAAWTDAAAAGWGGDRWEVWEKDGKRVALVATVWDTKRDAAEFAAALPDRPGLVWKRSGDRVGLIAGDAGERTREILAALVARPGSVDD